MNDDTHTILFDATSDSRYYEHKVSTDKIIEQLSSFGLTDNESKVYVFLGKYGSHRALDICKSLRLPRSEVYHILSSLQNKGIVSASFQHPIKFSAVQLDKAVLILLNAEKERVKYLESKEKQMIELWNNIPDLKLDPESTKDDKLQMLQSLNQIHSKIKEMISSAKNEFLILGSEKDFLKFYHADILESLESGISYKLLSSCTQRTMYIFDDIDRSKVKQLTQDLGSSCFVVKDDELLFFTKGTEGTGKEAMAMWSDSKQLTFSMKTLFDFCWSSAKKIHL